MDIQDKTKEELLSELKKLQQENNALKVLKEKRSEELIIANKELAIQNELKEKRAAELIIANKELVFQNEEKEKRAAELIIANKELAFQNELKEKRAAELIIANKELVFQNEEKEKRAAELVIANKELAIQNELKEKRADELVIANKELAIQNELKEKRAAELVIANKELAIQNELKEKRADELVIANKELAIQNELKEKRAAELIIANKELVFQNEEKEKRAAELIIANKELAFQNEEKEKRAVELIIAKEKAEEFERKFKQIAENIDEVFWLRTNSEMIYISPSFEKIWGIPCESIYENLQIFTEKIHPEDKAVVHEIFHSNEFKDAGLFNYEYRILRDENQVRWINAKTFPIFDESGQIIRRVGIAADTSEKYQSIQELIQAKKHAEESDRLKTAFLCNMSHEVRTPMNGILGFAGLLKEDNLSGEQQQQYIQIIEKSGARMLNIINDIVSISKIESGIIEIFISETNINNQVQFVYDSLKLDADNKKLNLSFNCALPEKEAIIKTDSEKFYSILSNLVKNAIKYTDKGTIEFGYVNKGEEFEFYVKDTGIGIPKDRQEAIFERFIQADIVDKMARQGAGLGLAISRAYVEMLGGKIWVESVEGFASTFFFTLPCNLVAERKTNTPARTETEAKQITPEISGLKVLIAEDDETSEMLISIELKKFSREILKASTGKETIETCRKIPDIDLVLMDIQMPDLNGYEATREIRKFNKKVIIIAQTAFALAGDREKAIESGCNDYIAKPVDKNELLTLIQKYFGK